MCHFTWLLSLLKSSPALTFFSAGWTPVINGRTPFFTAPFQGTRLPFYLPLVECNLLLSAEKKFSYELMLYFRVGGSPIQSHFTIHLFPLNLVLKSSFSIIRRPGVLILFPTYSDPMLPALGWIQLFVNGNTFQLIDYIHSHGYVNAVADGHLLSNILYIVLVQ